jgi:hypothetical protein
MTIYLAPDHRQPGLHGRLRPLGALPDRQDHQVFNPALLGEVAGWSWADYLKRDIPYLLDCEALFAMPGWEGSRGAQLRSTWPDAWSCAA